MFCKNCGNELMSDSKFCNKCGQSVTSLLEQNTSKKTLDNFNLADFGYNQMKAISYLKKEYGMSFLQASNFIAQKQKEKKTVKKQTKFCCPKCYGTDIDLVSSNKNMKTKKTTTLNLNPLKPFTIFNHNEKQTEKKSSAKIGLGIMTGGASLLVTGTKNKNHCEYFCRNCGHRWITK